jgi:AraC family transcriptional regulator of adaptative response / DNA-3-methyladenine glycosylase II
MPVRVGLAYRPPIDLAALIAFLDRRAAPGVEEVVDGGYRRSVRLAHGAAVIELRPGADAVDASVWCSDDADVPEAVRRSRALLDLDLDPAPVTAALGPDAVIGPLVRAHPGRRVPGHVDGAELAVRAVLGQQISVAAATTHAARLVAAFGEPLARPVGRVTHLFPTPAALARVGDPSRLAMPAARARALIGLARALARGEIVLAPGAGAEHALRALRALPGIGPWTASYVAMRALKDPDAFLAADLGVRRGLEALGRDGRPPAALALAEQWRPYRAYAVQHLWHSHALLHDRQPAR